MQWRSLAARNLWLAIIAILHVEMASFQRGISHARMVTGMVSTGVNLLQLLHALMIL
jgi:hypothetical protein